MKAGSMDRRITIQRATVTVDAFNNPIVAWASLCSVWAEKVEATQSELLAAREKGAAITKRFRIRYSDDVSDLSPADRFTFEGRTYDILGVGEIGRRRGLEITAIARAE
jgi:SPP1 family predicted phage head-tail adaptor